MSHPRYPIEPLLRPPIEFWSATVSFTSLLFLVVFRDELLLPQFCIALAMLSLICVVVTRTLQGIYVLWYQHGLTHSRPLLQQFNQLPHRAGYLYLGKGFQWSFKHTQRLRDTEQPEAEKYLHRRAKVYRRIRQVLQPTSTSVKTLPDSGKHQVHGVEVFKKKVWMNLQDRVGHTLVLGTTRVGKTRLAELLITQDIQRGEVVLVFDPKGDVELLRRMFLEAQRAGRQEHFFMFHLGYPQVSCRYNAIGRFSRITEVATRIANQLPGGGSSSAFKEFAWRFVNIIANALYALRQVPDYKKIRQYINDIEPLFVEYARNYLMRTAPAGWAEEVRVLSKSINARNLTSALKGRDPQAVALYQYIQKHNIHDPVLEGLVSAFKYDRTYFDKIVSSVGPLMEKLTTGAVADLIAPEPSDAAQRPILSWLEVIRNRGIVYIGLDALSDTTVAGAVGNSMFADLVSVAGYLYKYGIEGEGKPFEPPPKVCIHADEFNELIGDEFIPLLNKAGGAGYQVTAYTQTISDLEARVGSRSKSGQILGNFNSLVMLRVRELATAELLTQQLPESEVRRLKSSSSASDKSDDGISLAFKSSSNDQLMLNTTKLIEPSLLVSMPRGHAFAILDGGTLWKLRIPLPTEDCSTEQMTLEQVFSGLRSKYAA